MIGKFADQLPFRTGKLRTPRAPAHWFPIFAHRGEYSM